MISLGIEYSPPPTKKEIREWKKWRKEMNRIEEMYMPKATPHNKKNIKKKDNKKPGK
ncbi:MAG: hypothetical protein HY840_07165 [Bacteroidetes bacterium]|nr:hypothetical protein [Bacteroidota bacterium]